MRAQRKLVAFENWTFLNQNSVDFQKFLSSSLLPLLPRCKLPSLQAAGWRSNHPSKNAPNLAIQRASRRPQNGMASPVESSGNIDDAGKLKRRRHGIIMLAAAAAAYIGLIIPPDLDRRWLIASAAPCVAGIFSVVQSYQVTNQNAVLYTCASAFLSNASRPIVIRAADLPPRSWAPKRQVAA